MIPEIAAYLTGTMLSWGGVVTCVEAIRPRDHLLRLYPYGKITRLIIFLIGVIMIITSWIIFRMFA